MSILYLVLSLIKLPTTYGPSHSTQHISKLLVSTQVLFQELRIQQQGRKAQSCRDNRKNKPEGLKPLFSPRENSATPTSNLHFRKPSLQFNNTYPHSSTEQGLRTVLLSFLQRSRCRQVAWRIAGKKQFIFRKMVRIIPGKSRSYALKKNASVTCSAREEG